MLWFEKQPSQIRKNWNGFVQVSFSFKTCSSQNRKKNGMDFADSCFDSKSNLPKFAKKWNGSLQISFSFKNYSSQNQKNWHGFPRFVFWFWNYPFQICKIGHGFRNGKKCTYLIFIKTMIGFDVTSPEIIAFFMIWQEIDKFEIDLQSTATIFKKKPNFQLIL